MYICNTCDEIFDEYKIIEEHHPYGDTYAVEEFAVCPHCEDTDIDIAKQCSQCGEYVAELEDGMCKHCYSDMNE